jgi:hypothetical protein
MKNRIPSHLAAVETMHEDRLLTIMRDLDFARAEAQLAQIGFACNHTRGPSPPGQANSRQRTSTGSARCNARSRTQNRADRPLSETHCPLHNDYQTGDAERVDIQHVTIVVSIGYRHTKRSTLTASVAAEPRIAEAELELCGHDKSNVWFDSQNNISDRDPTAAVGKAGVLPCD